MNKTAVEVTKGIAVFVASTAVATVVGNVARIGMPDKKKLTKVMTVIGSAVISAFVANKVSEYVENEIDELVETVEELVEEIRENASAEDVVEDVVEGSIEVEIEKLAEAFKNAPERVPGSTDEETRQGSGRMPVDDESSDANEMPSGRIYPRPSADKARSDSPGNS
jgi:hypothetical protein